MDRTHAIVSWISVGGVALVLIVVHIWVGRVLVRDARRGTGNGSR
jgi:hypothetical protein